MRSSWSAVGAAACALFGFACVCAAGALHDGEATRGGSVVTAPSPTSGRAAGLPESPITIDLSDYYVFHGERVSLERAAGLAAVQVLASQEAQPLGARLAALVPGATCDDTEKAGSFPRVTLVHFGTNRSGQSDAERLKSALDALASSPDVEYAVPVLVNRETGTRLVPTDRILAKLVPACSPEEIAGRFGVAAIERLWHTEDEWVFRLRDPKNSSAVEVANAMAESGLVEWSEPDFLQEYRKAFRPNDPLLGSQWNLENTGQGGGTPGADANLPAAWNLTFGDPAIVIAVLDDGVDMTHEDLAPNMFTNTGEIPSNGLDDDGNGFVDDVHGWDFVAGDNDPSPANSNDYHGTLAAGVAAARGDNGVGVAGACPRCRILPVRTYSGSTVDNATVANAIRYAASLADVVSGGWSGTSASSAVESAIQWAVTNGRGGKGSVVAFPSGNGASAFYTYSYSVPAGTHRFRWVYRKDGSGSGGEDTAWLGWVEFPGGDRVDFEAGLPSGWATGGDAAWSVVDASSHVDEGWCLTRSAKAGTIGKNQVTYLETVRTVPGGTLTFSAWVSSKYVNMSFRNYLSLDLDLNNDGSWTSSVVDGGVPSIVTRVSYPAAFPESIAIGASTDFDCRASYSEYGPELLLVAPGSGGSSRVTTTDRTGSAGIDSGNYTSWYTGTSAASSLTAGVAGLVLSRNPSLTAAQVRQLLQDTAAKVGPDPYASGRNDRYGYGRLDAGAAVASVPLPPTITGFDPPAGRAGTSVAVTGSNLAGVTSLAFNATGTAFTVLSDTEVVTTVPAGATSGPIALRTPGGSATSRDGFVVNGCSYAIDPSSLSTDAGPGGGSVAVTADSECPWGAASHDGWLAVTSGPGGSGSGTVTYSFAANAGQPRTGTITIAGQSFTVSQGSTCSYGLDSAGATLPPVGGSGSVGVSTTPGCFWTAAADAAWISITSGAAGNGPGTVGFSVAPNPGPMRTGTATVAGQVFTVTESSGCGFVVTPTRAVVTHLAATVTVSVAAGGSCAWSAVSNDTWVTVASGSTGAGDGAVTLAVEANTGGVRAATVTIAGQIGELTQGDTSFIDSGAPIPGVTDAIVAWGDYDGDGRLDLVVTGRSGSTPTTKLLHNDSGGVFTDTGASLPGVFYGAIAWGDFDNDGDLDLLITGYGVSGAPVTKLLRNDGAGTFTEIASGLPNVVASALAWGDFDGDGRLDIILIAQNGSQPVTKIYRNAGGGSFVDMGANLAALFAGSVACGDYDNDGDLDILLMGYDGSGPVTKVYRNDHGVFTDIHANLPNVDNGAAAWGDYDNDGRLDIALVGSTYSGGVSAPIAKVFHNDGGGNFTDIGAALTPVSLASVGWGDYDNDGDLDLVVSGSTPSGNVTKVYRNDGGVFVDIGADLTGVSGGHVAWADYDDDGALDLLVAGYSGSGFLTTLYRNQSGTANSAPAPPPGLNAVVGADQVTLGWDAASDSETPSTGLTYNVRVGTTPGGVDVVAPMASASTGIRWLPEAGNGGENGARAIRRLRPGTYYWSVQAIDTGLAGSQFSPEESFTLCDASLSPTGRSLSAPGGTGTVTITTPSTCAWEAYSSVSWIVVSTGTSGVGDGVVQYSVTPNTGAARTGTIIIAGQTFTVQQSAYFSEAVLTPTVSTGLAVWGDFDGDGALDIFVGGTDSVTNPARILRNDGGVFTDIGTNFGLAAGGAAWGDFDNDGRLDLVVVGSTGSQSVVRIYHNDGGGVFTDIQAGLPGFSNASVDWGDFNNDGKLDLLLTGDAGWNTYVTKIYRNDGGGVFTDIGAALPGVVSGCARWGDYDNDGNLDILLTGFPIQATVFRNEGGGVFSDIHANFPAVYYSSAAWGDFDNDGNLDILLCGWVAGAGATTKLYRNNGSGGFTEVPAGLPGNSRGSVAWGDYDNDGNLDILITGDFGTLVYRNQGGGTFVNIGEVLPGGSFYCSSSWGDYDNDGALDILTVAGLGSARTCRVFHNDSAAPNSPPTPPGALTTPSGAGQVTLQWATAADDRTPTQGLTYNVRVATAPGGLDVLSPMSSLLTGRRDLPKDGNAAHRTSAIVESLPPGTYYWSVQAVDGAFAASPFAGESSFTVCSASVDPLSSSFVSAGGMGSATVTTGAGCTWVAETSSQWIKVTSGATGLGNGSVGFSVDPNPGPARSDTIRIAGQAVTVTQASGCVFSFSQPGAHFGEIGGPGSFSVTTYATCSWTPSTADAWVTLSSAQVQTGNGSVSYSVAMNPGSSDRTGTVSVGGTPFSITQDRSSFPDIAAGLPPLRSSVASLGDFDRDGNLDIAIMGQVPGGDGRNRVTKVFRNDGAGNFTDVGASLAGVCCGSLEWGDYDNDGDLDILLTGIDSNYTWVSKVYRNDGGGVFTEIASGLPGAYSASWVDYDNDGRLDVLLVGVNAGWGSALYHNDGNGVFRDSGAALPGSYGASMAWGDFDNDGLPDLLAVGTGFSGLYHNDGGGRLTSVDIKLGIVATGSVAWGDFDNDGRLDFAIAAHSYTDGGVPITRIYHNDGGGVFTDIHAALVGVEGGTVAWGDYDNDGKLDLLVTGTTQSYALFSKVYHNDGGGVFTDVGVSLPGAPAFAAWGDFDNDGKLDILLTGATSTTDAVTQIRHNGLTTTNTPPTAPTGLTAQKGAGQATLSWTPAADAQTPSSGLTYNVRVGTLPGGVDILSPMASSTNGQRTVPRIGNADERTTTLLTALPPGTYYWSVQAIDTTFAGSPFAGEGTVDVCDSSITPQSQNFAWSGGPATVAVSAPADCPWIAVSHSPWITITSGQAGSGSGSVAYSVAANPGTARQGRIVVAGKTLSVTQGSVFTEPGAALAGISSRSIAWGDFDNDGDLDLLVVGGPWGQQEPVAKIYRNDGNGVFTDTGANLTPVVAGSAAWGDYDNDGRLDILLTGQALVDGQLVPISKVYHNDGHGVFRDNGANLPGVFWGAVAWGDFDNDGRLDILLTGATASSPGVTSAVYHNNGNGSFTDIGANLVGMSESAVAVGDLDSDGWLDIVLTGFDYVHMQYATKVYRNVAGAFAEVATSLAGVIGGTVALGDYDNDGDLDILLTGSFGYQPVTKVYRNDGSNVFTDIGANLSGSYLGSGAWGDYDNDGRLDILLTGYATWPDSSNPSFYAKVFRNDGGGGFTDVGATLTPVWGGTAVWGDYDNDGSLDLALSGWSASGPVTKIYRNTFGAANTVPAAPTGLQAQAGAGQATLAWSPAADAQTPAAGLSYNVRVGSTPGGADVLGPMSAVPSGSLRVVQLGNAGERTTALVTGLHPGTYYWSVQAIDTAFSGSPFAAEGSLTTCAVTVNPALVTFSSAGGSGSVTVTTANGCAWTVVSNVSWISVSSGTHATGNGTVQFAVAASGSGPRRGTLTIAGQTVFVEQGDRYALSVGKDGSGSGTVASTPQGIDCGTTCSTTFLSGTVVRLAANPVGGSAFTGWSGEGCAGTGFCLVTMSQGRSATATFTKVAGAKFYPVTPCRVVDTRISLDPAVVKRGTFADDEVRAYTFSSSAQCPGLPTSAKAWSVNIQYRPLSHASYIEAFPDGVAQPTVATLVAWPARWRVNNAIVPAGSGGTIDVYSQYAGNVVIDVNGYFK